MKHLIRRYFFITIVFFFFSFFANYFVFQSSLLLYKGHIEQAVAVSLNTTQQNLLQESMMCADHDFSKHIIIALILLNIFLFTCMVVFLYRAVKKHIDPIEELSEAMDNFSFTYSEDFPRFEISGRPEINNLVRSFNQMRQKVLETVADIKSVSKYKQDFMTNVTHELKTPLTSILGYIETLEFGAIDEPEHSKKFIDSVKRNVIRLSALVDDVLNLTKIESSQATRTKVDVVEVFQLVVQDYDLTNRKNISITIKNKPIILYVDAVELYSAFSNYITNAIKYCPENSIKITLKVNENMFVFSVRDAGLGIEKEHQARIFERFYRLDKGRSRKEGGTGLGLAIVKNVVEKHGGSVGVISFVGKGSDFYFKLPMDKKEE